MEPVYKEKFGREAQEHKSVTAATKKLNLRHNDKPHSVTFALIYFLMLIKTYIWIVSRIKKW